MNNKIKTAYKTGSIGVCPLFFLDKAERLGWITSTNTWLETRQLRNQMIHEYIEDSNILLNALNAGHEFVSELADVAERMLSEIEMRVVNL